MSRHSKLMPIFLSGVTGMSVAGVSLLAYIRFQHPQQFADTSVKMSRPEIADEFTAKWGLFGSGIADAIPDSVKQWFVIPNAVERLEEQKRKRQQQIQQTIEDLRPKDK
ncbi:TPA: hypothetical protein N0F65_000561 [Lagenidium giganteum]|uniref:Uncharacterized protein n=1 Tax=Lagenidium giganteum TaxID=4803 RepID=A0AAV2Z243_9STRA|nr:TPA: hypothetical protein N0F65_000561 [Lagenidium giganteum]